MLPGQPKNQIHRSRDLMLNNEGDEPFGFEPKPMLDEHGYGLQHEARKTLELKTRLAARKPRHDELR